MPLGIPQMPYFKRALRRRHPAPECYEKLLNLYAGILGNSAGEKVGHQGWFSRCPAACTRRRADRASRRTREMQGPIPARKLPPRSRFHFPLCQISRRAGTRTTSGCEGAGARWHAVDLVAQEKLRRCHRPHEDVIRQRGLDAGLVDIKVCAVTDLWSGLKFVIPVKNRPKKEAQGQPPSAVRRGNAPTRPWIASVDKRNLASCTCLGSRGGCPYAIREL